jgi:NNP family nitrate/nitrite transporter-like MFS transporter
MFFMTGVGNASTFQMIPNIMRAEVPRLMPELSAEASLRQSEKESAAIVGFTSAIAAYGAFFIPKSFGSAIAATGSPMPALWGFLIFYASCAALTWWAYTHRGGLLHDIERGRAPSPTPSTAPLKGATA